MRVSSAHRKIADAAYEAVATRNSGRIDDFEDVRSEIKRTLPAVDTAMLVEQYVDQLASGADDRALERGRSPQLGLFTGTPVALEGFFPTGDGKRVKVGRAYAQDWVVLIQLKGDNVQAVSHEYQEWIVAHSRLLPWLSQGMTTEKALEEYRRANPQAAAPSTAGKKP